MPEQWVFSEYEAATKEVTRLIAATRQWFHLETTIWSNMWRAYGYEHQHEATYHDMTPDYLAEFRWSQ